VFVLDQESCLIFKFSRKLGVLFHRVCHHTHFCNENVEALVRSTRPLF